MVLFAQSYRTEVKFIDVPDNGVAKMEIVLSNLISEFNRASEENRVPKLSQFDMTERVKKSILMLWENSSFYCSKKKVAENVSRLQICDEFEFRNIPFVFTELSTDDQYHEVAISFNKSGTITGFNLCLNQNIYRAVFEQYNDVSDRNRRQVILSFLEQFRTAYEKKDIDFINKLFSDDALIIVGRVISTAKDNVKISNTEYFRKTKSQYINDLSVAFNNAKQIKVSFDEVNLTMHPTDKDWYGIQLKQGYYAQNKSGSVYQDKGYLFLLWDFSDEKKPQIHVRVWENNKYTPKEKLFSLDDIEIIK